MPPHSPVITIFGSSTARPNSPAWQFAEDLGRGIAQAGWTVCNGGYGGTMAASAHGAKAAGGHTIGVTCSILAWRGGPNPDIRQEIPTFDLTTRLNTLVRLGQAYVCLPGGTGTLLELALVWELVNKGMLQRQAPLILAGDHWAPLLEPIRREQPDALEPTVAHSVPDILRHLHAFFDPAPRPA